MVITRLQHKKNMIITKIYEVSIDFDYASKMWNKNKKKIGCGHYTYICGCMTKNGTPCKNAPRKNKKTCHLHKRIIC